MLRLIWSCYITVKTSISPTDQQDAFARSLVRKGRYASLSSVVQQGLDLLREKVETKKMEEDALRLLLKERRDRSFVSATEMEKKLNKIVEKK